MKFIYDENFKLLTVDMEGDTVYYKEEKPIDVINSETLPFHIMLTNGVFCKNKENSNQLYGGLKMNKCLINKGDIIKAKHHQTQTSYFIVLRVGIYLDDKTIFYKCNLLNSDGTSATFTICENDILEVYKVG